MFHGNVTQKIAQGLKELRARIDIAYIPPSTLDETINIGLSPSASDISWAQEFVEQFNSGGGKPKDGSDLPRLNRARIILKKARQLGLTSS